METDKYKNLLEKLAQNMHETKEYYENIAKYFENIKLAEKKISEKFDAQKKEHKDFVESLLKQFVEQGDFLLTKSKDFDSKQQKFIASIVQTSETALKNLEDLTQKNLELLNDASISFRAENIETIKRVENLVKIVNDSNKTSEGFFVDIEAKLQFMDLQNKKILDRIIAFEKNEKELENNISKLEEMQNSMNIIITSFAQKMTSNFENKLDIVEQKSDELSKQISDFEVLVQGLNSTPKSINVPDNNKLQELINISDKIINENKGKKDYVLFSVVIEGLSKNISNFDLKNYGSSHNKASDFFKKQMKEHYVIETINSQLTIRKKKNRVLKAA